MHLFKEFYREHMDGERSKVDFTAVTQKVKEDDNSPGRAQAYASGSSGWSEDAGSVDAEN